MGCSDSRQDTSHEEKCIVFSEKALNFHLKTCIQIDSIFRKYSHDFYLNEAQFTDAARVLQLQAKNSPQYPNIELFFEALKFGDKYKLEHLITLGALLSYGDQMTKAQILFEAFDRTHSKVLSSSEILDLLELMFELSVVHLPLLVAESQILVKAESLNVYLHHLKAGVRAATLRIATKLIGDNEVVSFEQFISTFASGDLLELRSPHDIRAFVLAKSPYGYSLF